MMTFCGNGDQQIDEPCTAETASISVLVCAKAGGEKTTTAIALLASHRPRFRCKLRHQFSGLIPESPHSFVSKRNSRRKQPRL
jgi:hypothetical protein